MDRDLILSAVLAAVLSFVLIGGYSFYMMKQTNGEASALVGTWFGEAREGKRHVAWRLDSRADKTFGIEFRSYSECNDATTMTQAGVWSAQWPFHHMDVQSIDGEERSFSNTYVVVWLSAKAIAYILPEAPAAFHSRRVPDDFEFSGCYAEAASSSGSVWGQ